MPRYEVQIDDSYADLLQALGAARSVPVPELIRRVVEEELARHRDECVSDEFKRLVADSIAVRQPVLRRLAA